MYEYIVEDNYHGDTDAESAKTRILLESCMYEDLYSIYIWDDWCEDMDDQQRVDRMRKGLTSYPGTIFRINT